MEEQLNNESGKRSRRGLFGLLFLLVGLLIGAFAMLLIFNVRGLHRRPTEVRVIERDTASVRDTVVIIHEFKNPSRIEQSVDTIMPVDSALLEEESQDFLLEYPDDLDEGMDDNPVPSEVMLDKMTPKIVVWDENKKEVPSAEKSENFQIQLWSTPFKNRIEYHFEGNIIKVKGLMIDNLKVLHYQNEFFLVSQKRIYPIHQNKQFERLVETHEFTM
ncbi:MAG: hypothetical protein K6A41_02795 [Bacteroidales bacterium]|nr:hypothetical protein [Bacteroidales bacterium]